MNLEEKCCMALPIESLCAERRVEGLILCSCIESDNLGVLCRPAGEWSAWDERFA